MSGKFGVSFNGRTIVHPGAYDYLDASAMTAVSPGVGNLPIVVGTSNSGEPGLVHWFSDISKARAYLGGGDLLDALELIFSPTSDGGGADKVGVLIANKSTRATLTTAGVNFTSLIYGEDGNKIQASVQTGSLSETKKIIVERWDTNQVEVFDNLGALLNVQYTGQAAYCSVEVTSSYLQFKIGSAQGDATPDLKIDFTQERYNTIGKIVTRINSTYGYSASTYPGCENIKATLLKTKVETSLEKNKLVLLGTTKSYTEVVNSQSNLVNITCESAVTVASSYSLLTGGATGEVPESWVDLFDVLKNEFSDILVVLSDNEVIHAEALAHINAMEKRNQKQVLFTGGGTGETVQQACNRAMRLNSSRAVIAYPDFYHSYIGGGTRKLPAYFMGALIAGRVCGVDTTEPVTFDYVNVLSLGKDLVAGDPEVDDLLNSGVATVERVRSGGFRIVQGITTYTQQNNSLYREISVRRGADKLTELIRNDLENTFVGRKAVPSIASAVKTRVMDILDKNIRDGVINEYKNLVVRVQADVIYVDVEVSPTEGVNYILITSHFVPSSPVIA